MLQLSKNAIMGVLAILVLPTAGIAASYTSTAQTMKADAPARAKLNADFSRCALAGATDQHPMTAEADRALSARIMDNCLPPLTAFAESRGGSEGEARSHAAGVLVGVLQIAAPTDIRRPQGAIRICRHPGLTEEMDHSSVPIPAGTGYTSGETKDGEQLKPFFLVRTLDAVVLSPKPGCVTIKAALIENPEHFSLTTKYPTFLPSQLGVAGL